MFAYFLSQKYGEIINKTYFLSDKKTSGQRYYHQRFKKSHHLSPDNYESPSIMYVCREAKNKQIYEH